MAISNDHMNQAILRAKEWADQILRDANDIALDEAEWVDDPTDGDVDVLESMVIAHLQSAINQRIHEMNRRKS